MRAHKCSSQLKPKLGGKDSPLYEFLAVHIELELLQLMA